MSKKKASACQNKRKHKLKKKKKNLIYGAKS